MRHNLENNVADAVSNLMKNFEKEFENISRRTSTKNRHSKQNQEYLFSDGDSSFGESSLNHVSLDLFYRTFFSKV